MPTIPDKFIYIYIFKLHKRKRKIQGRKKINRSRVTGAFGKVARIQVTINYNSIFHCHLKPVHAIESH